MSVFLLGFSELLRSDLADSCSGYAALTIRAKRKVDFKEIMFDVVVEAMIVFN